MVEYLKKRLFASNGSSSSGSTPNIYTFKQTITAAQMATIGTSPVTLVAPPGANKYICVTPGSLCFRKTGGTTNGYTFDASTTGFGLTWINGGFFDYFSVFDLSGFTSGSTATRFLFGVSSVKVFAWADYQHYWISSANSGVILGTSNLLNPTAGDNDIIISFTYSIIDVS